MQFSTFGTAIWFILKKCIIQDHIITGYELETLLRESMSLEEKRGSSSTMFSDTKYCSFSEIYKYCYMQLGDMKDEQWLKKERKMNNCL